LKIISNTSDQTGLKWVATVGFFDGVHKGHRFLIRSLRQLANGKGLPSAVLTFPVHPRVVLQTGFVPLLLNSFDERMELLAANGIDACLLVDFTSEMAALSARDFITDVLSKQWHVDTLLVGYDHRFGHNRIDGFEQYVEYGRACGMEVVRAGACESGEETVSSSRIRQLLSEGKVEEAAQLLTYPYLLNGCIVHGNRIGRTLGFPTANIEMDDPHKILPAAGVYAVWVRLDGTPYKGMLSIGNRPTLNGRDMAVEVHLLHFSGLIYGRNIEILFVRRMRDNKKFENLEALKAQLAEDSRIADEILST
jgi:riboflavin kinase/FMN adenylyltransferase